MTTESVKVTTTYNLNVQCRVVLTDAGLATLEEYFKKNFKDFPEILEVRRKSLGGESEREYTTTLWEIMHIFGPKISMGNNNAPFVNNECCITQD